MLLGRKVLRPQQQRPFDGYLAGKLLLWVRKEHTIEALKAEVERLLKLDDTRMVIENLLTSFLKRLELFIKCEGGYIGY